MKGYFGRKSIAFFMVFMFLLPFLPVLNVGASQATRELRDRIRAERDAARQQVREQNQLLEGTRAQMSEVLAEIQELDQRWMDAASALDEIELSLEYTELRIVDAEEELEAARYERDLQYNVLREWLRATHEHGQASLLEVLFQATSITDFFIRLEAVRVVAQFDQEMLERLEASERDYVSAVDELARSRILILDLQHLMEAQKREIQALQDERYVFFEELQQNEEIVEELLAIMEAEQHALEVEFGRAQAQYDRELAEAERRRQEEARARAAAERNARLANLNSFGGNFQWPVPASAHVTSHFGNRPSPITGRWEFHTGTDVGAPTGSRILAMADGYVRFSGWSGGFGNTVIIDHADGYSTLYAHNSRNRVQAGQFVRRGEHIADVGSTGMSTGPHLHFEIRLHGTHRDPMGYFR